LTEYTASNFNGTMTGDLLTVSFDFSAYRVPINGVTGLRDGQVEELFSNIGNHPLDLTALGDTDPFPGTIWVANYGSGAITVFEPNDYDGTSPTCTGAYDITLDEDGDGFSNADEIDNGTDPCSAGSQPADWDGDFISNLNDPDDDNDGLPDGLDPFAIDDQNGRSTTLPVLYTWENDAPDPGGFLGLGFTGLMANGIDEYDSLFDPTKMTAGGAAGVLTVDSVSEGDARGSSNSQEYAFQFGVDLPLDVASSARTRIASPFAGLTPSAGQSMGIFVGDGFQDDYVKVVVAGDGGGAVQLMTEYGGIDNDIASVALDLTDIVAVDLQLLMDPIVGEITAHFNTDDGTGFGPWTQVGGPVSLPTDWLSSATAPTIGIISTSSGPAPEFPATWDFIEVVEVTPTQTSALGVSPGVVDFGVVTVGDSVSDAVVLSNLGGSGDPQVTVTGVTLGGADAAEFSHDLVVPVILDPGETVAVNVAHTAADVGSKTAILSFQHDGSNSPTTVDLTAEDVDPGAAVGSALLSVTASGGFDASTFNGGSFVVENTSTGGVRIAEVTVDLRGSLVTDAVFDPDGLAGDPAGKGFTPDSGGPATGLGSHSFGSPHDDGYDTLTVDFSDFDPGEVFTFSADIDPTSIRGAPAPGPNDSGSVSGLELSGAPVTVTFTDGSTITGNLFAGPTNAGHGEVFIEQTTTTTPVISIVGESSPTTLTDPNITVRITGTPGDTVKLIHTESGLFLDGVPNGGFDIDPYESNNVISITRHTITIEPDGTTDLPIVLTKTSPETGINTLIATTTNPTTGAHTHTTNTLTIQHNPS
jgi:hypothetical protein